MDWKSGWSLCESPQPEGRLGCVVCSVVERMLLGEGEAAERAGMRGVRVALAQASVVVEVAVATDLRRKEW